MAEIATESAAEALVAPAIGAQDIPDYVRAAAKAAPGQWIGLVDPTWQGEGPPPAWAVLGEWLGDEGGEVTEFKENEEYRPSPLAHEWPEPTDPVDAAVQLAATGYGSPEDVLRALAGATVALAVGEDKSIQVVELPDGERAVLVYTAEEHLEAAEVQSYGEVELAGLVGNIPEGLWIMVNLGGPVSMRIDPADVRALLEAQGAAAVS
ncbi:hypothetical protein ABH930_000227 [Kitasatospora sp. GAS204A]|uniref:type VII secretion system-associated protein n=1 Tax=unclassified Kitasatospora TaxID=2633591 RepID=UPI0024737A35|nr:type VII secretion system-associated protein [Kitasatospora sp. GAS204B]MDH6116808.1 hypothetical protein [Kitasatospora sp. GAS204B]